MTSDHPIIFRFLYGDAGDGKLLSLYVGTKHDALEFRGNLTLSNEEFRGFLAGILADSPTLDSFQFMRESTGP